MIGSTATRISVDRHRCQNRAVVPFSAAEFRVGGSPCHAIASGAHSGGAGGSGRAGGARRGLLELHLQAARQARGPRPRCSAAAPDQRHLPHLQVPATLLRVLLPQRCQVLHHHHSGQPAVQLRVQGRLRGPALRVQGSGRVVPVVARPSHAGDGVHRGRGQCGHSARAAVVSSGLAALSLAGQAAAV